LKSYNIIVVETLVRKVSVDAKNKRKALDMVRDQYKNEEIVLDYNDYWETEFKISL
jgi:hypothetical protein